MFSASNRVLVEAWSSRLRMDQPDRILALIGEIYDTALQRALWPRVVESICEYVGSTSASLESQKTVRKLVDLHFSWGIADDYLRRWSNDELGDDETRRRLAVIVPHVRRALLIGKVLDLPSSEAAAFGDTLDGLCAALFLLGANAGIVHANASGDALMREGCCLSGHGGRLRAVDPQADRSLRNILADITRGDASMSVGGMAVPLKSRSGQRYVAHVLPLTAGARRKSGTSYAAVAAVFVRKAEVDLLSPFEAIAQDFQLTPGELRVLCAIVEIGGVRETASVLGISETTVKTHLQRLFEKTTTSRQADLVRLVAGYASPVCAGDQGSGHRFRDKVARFRSKAATP
jgi:DNA-binding CsgD family transcriptional regulator